MIIDRAQRVGHARRRRRRRRQRDGAAPIVGSSAAIRAVRARIERVAATDFTVLDRRRERRRQGTRGAPDSRSVAAARRSVRRGQLRRDRRDAARGRAVRDRGAHRDRRARTARQVRARARRHAVSRRGRRTCRPPRRRSCCARSRRCRSSASAESAAGAVDTRIIAATNQTPVAISSRAAGFASISSIGSTASRSSSLRCGSGTEDILELAEYFLERHREFRRLRLSQAASDALLAYRWPGNVRELRARDRARRRARRLRIVCSSTICRRRCSTATRQVLLPSFAAVRLDAGVGQPLRAHGATSAATTTSGRRAASWGFRITR